MNNYIRDLGFIESYMTHIHDKLGGNTQGSQLVSVNGYISNDAFNEAVRVVFDKYSALRCKLARHGNVLYFANQDEFSKIEIRHIRLDEGNDWLEIFEEETSVVIDPYQSMWRVTLLSTPDSLKHKIIITAHHSIIDGTGVFRLLEDILIYLDEILSGKSAYANSVGFPPPIDDYLLPQPSASSPAAEVNYIPFFKDAPLAKRKTKVKILDLSKADTATYIDKCKSSGLTQNSVLSAALAKAIITNNICTPPFSFKTAVSLRDRANEEQHRLGCYITVADSVITGEHMDVKSLAKSYDKQLLTGMLKKLIRKQTSDVSMFDQLTNGILESRVFDHGIAITNAGEVQSKLEYNNFTIDDWQTINNRVAGNFAVVLHTLMFDKMLKFGLVYADPLTGSDIIDIIANDFINNILEFNRI